jgi:hypothetical protein
MAHMAALAYYGHVPPSEFEAMDPDESLDLVKRVIALHREDREEVMKASLEQTKALMKQIAARPSM